MTSTDRAHPLGRRAFLQTGALAGIGLTMLPLHASAQTSGRGGPRVQRYVTLGRTGMRISDVSFGASRLGAGEGDLVRHALDRGINYFDTADSYRGGDSETTVGEVLRGKRDRVFITSKTYTSPSERRDAMMGSLEQSLRRLRTDYVDVYFNHAVNEVERLKNPEWREFTARAKQQGKIRFVGMSGHAGRLIECLDYAIDTDSVDVILVAYNFGQDPSFYQKFTRSFDFVARQPDLPRVLAKAKAKNVGVVAMKTLMGARLNDMRPFEKGGATFSQAALRWVLSGKNVDALIISMTSAEHDRRVPGRLGLAVDGQRRPAAAAALREHARHLLLPPRLPGLPHRLPVQGADRRGAPDADVRRGLRRSRPGEEPSTRCSAASAAACLSCAAKPCQSACPHGLPIENLLGPGPSDADRVAAA